MPRLLPRSIPLAGHLLVAFVTLVVGTTAGLTLAAYRSSLASLEASARSQVRLAAHAREQGITQFLALRLQRADAFLLSAELLCGEPASGGRIGWSEECVGTMLQGFRAAERAAGARLTYRGRTLARAGADVARALPAPGATAYVLPGLVRTAYVMAASHRDTTLAMQFPLDEIRPAFADRSGLGATGEVFMADAAGAFLTPARYSSSPTPPGAAAVEPFERCRQGGGESVEYDYRGVVTIHGFRPVDVLEGACIDAHISYDEAMAPAVALRSDLAARGAAFALAGAFASLIAAYGISAPVRRLAVAARGLRDGMFTAPVPIGGPAEVRDLGMALRSMGSDLAQLITREQTARLHAETVSRLKDEFLATVSHELRTPLTAVLGWTRILRSGHLDEAGARRALDAIERGAEAQRRLVEDLLDVSRIVSQRLRLVRSAVSLSQVTAAALDAVRPQATEKNVRLDYTAPDGELVVLGDEQRLEQVVWNLVWNAVKFTPSGGHVRVELSRVGDSARLTIADTGVGISPSFLPHVFEWFRQEDSLRQSQGGLGLGLGIVRDLVQLHGGSVRAQSGGEGLGSTFVVEIPVSTAQNGVTFRPAVPRISELHPDHLRDVRVLVVEDDADSRDVIKALLEEAGATVRTAADASGARLELSARDHDVLVSDIRMPDEDGYSLVRALREAQVSLPAIALTAYARKEDADLAHAAGFQVHMPKPVDPTRLVDTIAALARGDTVH